MNKDYFFNEEILDEFADINSKIYNLNHSFKFFIDSLENQSETSLSLICLGHILQDYIKVIKYRYYNLLEKLDVLK